MLVSVLDSLLDMRPKAPGQIPRASGWGAWIWLKPRELSHSWYAAGSEKGSGQEELELEAAPTLQHGQARSDGGVGHESRLSWYGTGHQGDMETLAKGASHEDRPSTR